MEYFVCSHMHISTIGSHSHQGGHMSAKTEYTVPAPQSHDSIALIKLTVPFEEGKEAAAERKRAKYDDLLARCTTLNPHP